MRWNLFSVVVVAGFTASDSGFAVSDQGDRRIGDASWGGPGQFPVCSATLTARDSSNYADLAAKLLIGVHLVGAGGLGYLVYRNGRKRRREHEVFTE
ncbi:hypothetical protein [Methylibium sp.]|uniref:hypothetical protein n=1 Tax=Methylibium sp. TaxID=2067992 RepID=UPI003D1392FA